jgi:hypothetical protein
VPLPPPRPPTKTTEALPSAVRYRGQPASRWWQFEDRATNFADIDAGPADLARLVVTEFAVAYTNDWFVVPARVTVGTATEVRAMSVIDNFGDTTSVTSVATHDGSRERVWRMFELTDDEVTKGHPSPWLVVAPTVCGDLTGDALERITFVRDEGANLVWGVERLVEGPNGRALDRALLASSRSPNGNGDGDDDAPPLISYEAMVWKYRLESGVPPAFWIPFVAERITGGSSEVVLRRARMQQWSGSAAGGHGVVLDASRPQWVREEEVPKSGVRVDRRWRYARGSDGRGHLWLQLEKSPAAGERSSGVRWDVIEISGSPLATP